MRKLIWLAGAAFWVTACASLSPTPTPEPTPLAVVPTMKTVPPQAQATPPPAVPDPRADDESTMKVVTAESQKERAEANKLKVRPTKNDETDAAVKSGKVVGPVVTYAGAARADGNPSEPIGKTKDGWPIFLNHVGSGFIVVVEVKPGFSNLEAGRSIFRHDPNDPSKRPDLEIQVDKPMGDGSETVCDARPPNFGGIPAISPADFAETAKISGALNDLSCRFETFIESDSSCTNAPSGDFSFVSDDATLQFCMVVARKWRFAEGDTTVSVRVRDREGNPGPVSKFVIRREDRPKQTPHTPVPATPTPVRRRP